MMTDAYVHALLDAAKDNAAPTVRPTHLTVCSAYPGKSGTPQNESATTRQAITLAAAAGRAHAIVETPTVPMPAASEAQYVVLASALTVGSFLCFSLVGGGSLKGCTYEQAGNSIRSEDHGLANDDRVAFFSGPEDAVPGGITEGDLLYVVSVAADTFQVSLTQGGAAIVLTTDGECTFQKGVPEVFAAAGDLNVSAYSETIFV